MLKQMNLRRGGLLNHLLYTITLFVMLLCSAAAALSTAPLMLTAAERDSLGFGVGDGRQLHLNKYGKNISGWVQSYEVDCLNLNVNITNDRCLANCDAWAIDPKQYESNWMFDKCRFEASHVDCAVWAYYDRSNTSWVYTYCLDEVSKANCSAWALNPEFYADKWQYAQCRLESRNTTCQNGYKYSHKDNWAYWKCATKVPSMSPSHSPTGPSAQLQLSTQLKPFLLTLTFSIPNSLTLPRTLSSNDEKVVLDYTQMFISDRYQTARDYGTVRFDVSLNMVKSSRLRFLSAAGGKKSLYDGRRLLEVAISRKFQGSVHFTNVPNSQWVKPSSTFLDSCTSSAFSESENAFIKGLSIYGVLEERQAQNFKNSVAANATQGESLLSYISGAKVDILNGQSSMPHSLSQGPISVSTLIFIVVLSCAMGLAAVLFAAYLLCSRRKKRTEREWLSNNNIVDKTVGSGIHGAKLEETLEGSTKQKTSDNCKIENVNTLLTTSYSSDFKKISSSPETIIEMDSKIMKELFQSGRPTTDAPYHHRGEIITNGETLGPARRALGEIYQIDKDGNLASFLSENDDDGTSLPSCLAYNRDGADDRSTIAPPSIFGVDVSGQSQRMLELDDFTLDGTASVSPSLIGDGYDNDEEDDQTNVVQKEKMFEDMWDDMTLTSP